MSDCGRLGALGAQTQPPPPREIYHGCPCSMGEEAKGWRVQTPLGSCIPPICRVTLDRPFTALRLHLLLPGVS